MSKKVHQVQDSLRQLDIVFVIDTTSSMAPWISEVQKRLRSFIGQLTGAKISPSVSFGVVAYRDHPPQDHSYVTKVYALTENITKAQANIDGLDASGGGDAPEAVIDGLRDAVATSTWRKSAHKVIVLVGDAPPHGAGLEGDNWPKGCPCSDTVDQIAAKARAIGITVHTVGVGSSTVLVRSFTQIAATCGGEFVLLKNVESLIARILDLFRAELGKVEVDIDTYGAWATASDKSARGLAEATGKSVGDVDASLQRLREKGVIAPNEAISEEMQRLLGRDSAAPAVEVDNELLRRITIISSTSPVDPSAEGGDFGIRILDR